MKRTSESVTTSRARLGRSLPVALGIALAAGAVVAPVAGGSVSAEDPGVDCAEWDAANFTADVDRLNGHMVRVWLTYDDSDEPFDVCPYTIFFDLRDGDGDVVWSSWVAADFVAAETESVVGAFKYLMPHQGCDWEVHVAIEESMPIVLDSPDLCLDDLRFTIEPRVPIEPDGPPAWSRPVRSLPVIGVVR